MLLILWMVSRLEFHYMTVNNQYFVQRCIKKFATESASTADAANTVNTVTAAAATASVDSPPPRCPPCIEIGKYRVTTWYSSPYPQNYAR